MVWWSWTIWIFGVSGQSSHRNISGILGADFNHPRGAALLWLGAVVRRWPQVGMPVRGVFLRFPRRAIGADPRRNFRFPLRIAG
jgi:hypothetical protein